MTQKKMEILFIFTALLPCLWILILLDFWTTIPGIKYGRELAKKEYANFLEKKGVKNQLSKYLFLVGNSHIIYPIRGMIIVISLLALFIFINKHFV
jgi:hypothetical protein